MEYEKGLGELSQMRLQQILRSIPASDVRTLEGKTEFKTENAGTESTALSYESLRRLSREVTESMNTDLARFNAIVIYNEQDFRALAKYRVFRLACERIFKDYQSISSSVQRQSLDLSPGGTDQVRTNMVDPLSASLSLPAIGTAYLRSVAGLIATFRTDTVLTESSVKVGRTAFGSVMSRQIQEARPDTKIFFPAAFVAEYDLPEEGQDSLLGIIARLAEIESNLTEFLSASKFVVETRRNSPDYKQALNDMTRMLEHVKALGQSAGFSASRPRPESAMTEFQELIRAEKLDRFLRSNGAKVGILHLNVLSLGGTRQETKNLFLGNKVTYSGSAVAEVLLFDIDGMLRRAEVFSNHTGFKKLKRDDEISN